MNKVAFVACSNEQDEHEIYRNVELKLLLEDMHIEVVESPYLYIRVSGKQKAEILNNFYKDESIDAIFDISGGDLANEVLPYLDYELIEHSHQLFFGYSDLTTIINAIYSQTKKSSVLFQMKHLVRDDSGIQVERFKKYLQDYNDLFDVNWHILQGKDNIENHIVLGGNIRCFLKLAGTKYMPDLNGKLLFLEALSGDVPQISTYMAQLNQLGAFQQVNGILLGTFMQIEKYHAKPTVYDILKQYIDPNMFVAQTDEIGHSITSKALRIG